MTSQPGPRVLVTDAVPMNGGDELLLRALLGALRRRWPNSTATVMTRHVAASRMLLPDVDIVGDLQVAPADARRAYAAADLVISTPGGFLNRHYDFTSRLEGFHAASAAGRPLALYAQSIGPFGDEMQHAAVGEALRGASLVAVRDAISLVHLARCGVTGSHVVEVPDAAFLWPVRPATGDPARPVRRVAFSLRRWPRDDATMFRETVRKTRRLMQTLRTHGVEAFVFASTCQGLDGYVDDADLSRRVVAGLTPDLAARTVVHEARLSPAAFIDLMATCDMFVGMRLHGCLMAMLAGTPALGLAYEDKTPQIFDQLGFGAWQLPFTRKVDEWCRRGRALVAAAPAVRAVLPERLAASAARATASLELLATLIDVPARQA